MNKSKLLDHCPLCGKQLPDNHATTKLIHHLMNHPWYLWVQANRIVECIDNGMRQDVRVSRKTEGEKLHD
jgi:hypothetical protein